MGIAVYNDTHTHDGTQKTRPSFVGRVFNLGGGNHWVIGVLSSSDALFLTSSETVDFPILRKKGNKIYSIVQKLKN